MPSSTALWGHSTATIAAQSSLKEECSSGYFIFILLEVGGDVTVSEDGTPADDLPLLLLICNHCSTLQAGHCCDVLFFFSFRKYKFNKEFFIFCELLYSISEEKKSKHKLNPHKKHTVLKPVYSWDVLMSNSIWLNHLFYFCFKLWPYIYCALKKNDKLIHSECAALAIRVQFPGRFNKRHLV